MLNNITLNIELFVGTTNEPIMAQAALAAVRAAFPCVPAHGMRHVVMPNRHGRDTLICMFALDSNADLHNPCYALAETLGQEAIALTIDGGGALIGPNAAGWAPFDPAEFLPYAEHANHEPMTALEAWAVLRSFLPSDDVLGKAGLEAGAVLEYHLLSK